jgi:L-threonylcarbamoyladenylate synthase
MTTFVPLDDATALDVAEAALRAGGAVVLPTDTVYGVATLPPFVDVLYRLKGRPDAVPIAVLVASVDQARELIDLSPVARRVAEAFWPGPLTLVARRVDAPSTLGVRCPDHAFVRALAARVGPLSTTSCNRHGQPTPPDATDAAASLDGAVAAVIDGGPCAGEASTVVDASDDPLTILRKGPISEQSVRAAALT